MNGYGLRAFTQTISPYLGQAIQQALAPQPTPEEEEERLWNALDATSKKNVRTFLKEFEEKPTLLEKQRYFNSQFQLLTPKERQLVMYKLQTPYYQSMISALLQKPQEEERERMIAEVEKRAGLGPGPIMTELEAMAVPPIETVAPPSEIRKEEELTTAPVDLQMLWKGITSATERQQVRDEIAKLQKLDPIQRRIVWAQDKRLFTPQQIEVIEGTVPLKVRESREVPEVEKTPISPPTIGLVPRTEAEIPELYYEERGLEYTPEIMRYREEIEKVLREQGYPESEIPEEADKRARRMAYIDDLMEIDVNISDFTANEREIISVAVDDLLDLPSEEERIDYFFDKIVGGIAAGDPRMQAYIFKQIHTPLNWPKYMRKADVPGFGKTVKETIMTPWEKFLKSIGLKK